MRVAGFVLTGGLSSRMGQDKALLPMGSQTLCEHIADIVSTVAGQVFLIGHPERYGHLKYKCIADLRPGLGPLSGLETALSLEVCEFHIIVSCDTMNLKPEWLQQLLTEAERGFSCVVVQDASRNVQPLCGVYRSNCRGVVTRALSEGRLRMMDLLQELGASKVTIEEALLNVNTPGDYADSRK